MGILARRSPVGQECPTYDSCIDKAVGFQPAEPKTLRIVVPAKLAGWKPAPRNWQAGRSSADCITVLFMAPPDNRCSGSEYQSANKASKSARHSPPGQLLRCPPNCPRLLTHVSAHGELQCMSFLLLISNWLTIISANRLTQQSATDLDLIVGRYHSPQVSDLHVDIATQNILTGR